MYFNPYLRRPDVPGSSRCKFVYQSQEVISRDDTYTGKRRYRFNKWMPISDSYPDMHKDGMMFKSHQRQHLSGIASAFTINPNDTGSVSFLCAPQTINKFNVATDHLELGVGFLKYTESWWGVAEGCELAYVRSNGKKHNGCYSTTLRNNIIPTSYSSFNPSYYSKYTLNYSPLMLSILYEEYTASGAIVWSHSVSHAIDNVTEQHPYRVVFYLWSEGDCSFQIPLVRTVINLPLSTISGKETIYFNENPQTYKPPIAPLRDRGIHIYYAPHVALVEDGTITVASNYASSEWINTLKFLMNSSIETFLFTDPDGIEFRCVMSDLEDNTARITEEQGNGYTLTLPVIVVH